MGPRANNTGISLLKKKESKCQTGVFLETVAAPSNLFPLIKHVNVLQQCLEKRPEDAAVPAARGTAADSGVTAQSFGLGAGAEREHSCRQSCGGGGELPLKTQKTTEVLQESLFWWRPHHCPSLLAEPLTCCCESCRCCHCFCRVGEMEVKINVIAGPFMENFSRKEFMVRLVDFYRTFVLRGSIQVKQ